MSLSHFDRSLEDRCDTNPSAGVAPSHYLSPIEKLDFDTFSLILQYVMAQNVGLDDLEANLSHRRERVLPITHYPGRVAQRWHYVCINTPSLWKDIVYFVDSPRGTHELQQLRLKTCLERSQPLNIRLYIGRKRHTPLSLDLGEAYSVKAALSTCRSDLERVEALMVETNQASSLPRVLTLGHPGPLPKLKSLVLTSNVDDSILQLTVPSRSTIHTHYPFPALTRLYVDGGNLLSMLESSRSRTGLEVKDAFTSMSMLEEIGINNLTYCVDGFSVELIRRFFFDIIPSFPHLTTLGLVNFELTDDRRSTPAQIPTTPPPLPPLSLSSVIIKQTRTESIDFVLGCTHPNTLVLVDCYLNGPLHLPTFSSLIVIDFSTDLDHALAQTIARCQGGGSLELRRCACVDRSFWAALQREFSVSGHRMLVDPEDPHDVGRFKSIKVVDCPRNLSH